MDGVCLFPPWSIFTGARPETSCVSRSRAKRKKEREGATVSVFVHIFPVWHVASFSTHNSTWHYFTHTYGQILHTAYFSAQAALSGV